VIETTDGRTFETEAVESPWDQSDVQQPDKPPDQELLGKFHWLVSGTLSRARATKLEQSIWQCDELADAQTMANLLRNPGDNRSSL
jgi:hypothetical protein